MPMINRTPGTCSLMNMTGITGAMGIEEACQKALTKEKADGFLARMSAIFCVVTRRDFVAALKAVGFREIAKYTSHNHRTTCSIMLRKVKEKEFNTGKLSFQKKKGIK